MLAARKKSDDLLTLVDADVNELISPLDDALFDANTRDHRPGIVVAEPPHSCIAMVSVRKHRAVQIDKNMVDLWIGLELLDRLIEPLELLIHDVTFRRSGHRRIGGLPVLGVEYDHGKAAAGVV